MAIKGFEIIQNKSIPLDTNASTLDELTRQLPEGFYTTFSTLYKGTKVLGLHQHLRRLYGPAKEVGLTPSTDEKALREQIYVLAKSNLPNESRVRLILTKDSGRVYVGIQPFESLPEAVYKKGVHVITTELARTHPNIKDSGFITSSQLLRKQIKGDVFEALLTKNSRILEGMTSNFYEIRGKTITTAKTGILPGVTRTAVLSLAKDLGMRIKFEAPKINERFDEAFLTSSSRGVVPIISIDDRSVGKGRPGEWTKRLSKAYQDYVHERSESIIR